MNRKRRRLLQGVGVGTVGTIAGCGSDGGDGGDGDGGGDGTTTGGGGTQTTGGGSGGAPTVISMTAGGKDIWNAADLGYYYYTTVTGDFDVRVNVASLENTNPHAKAGIMVRESLDADSKNVMARSRAGFGISPQWRPEAGAQTTSTTSEAGKDLARVEGGTMEGNWVRLQRAGSTIRVYGSEEGEEWTLMVELPSSVVSFSDEVYLGLAATSHNSGSATTAKFRSLEGVEPTEKADLGNPAISGSVEVTESAIVSSNDPTDLSPSAATLQATVEAMGDVTLDASFQYREATSSEWQSVDAGEVSEPGTFSAEITGLSPRTYYYFRPVVKSEGTTVRAVRSLFSTPSGSSGSSETGPRSASAFDPDDGFADMAPWVDDDTPIVRVTEASRESLERATNIPGPRIVVFETSGTIDLGAENLNVRNDKIWIAGQTAPSPGITLVRGGVWIYGNDCVVQHVRVRPGTAAQDTGWQPDAIEVADDTQNNIVDHCTGTWSIDENINAGYDTTDTTISNCLIAEPLNEATHAKGAHGYNSILGNNGKNVCCVGNVYAFGTDRNPRVKQGVTAVIANNLMHYFSDGAWIDPDTETSIVGNDFERPQTDQANVFGRGTSYVAQNVSDGGTKMVGSQVNRVDSQPIWPENLETIATGEVHSHNVANAGARPADRSSHDQRIIDQIENGEGGVIDNQSEVGGYPALPENTEELDIPTSNLRAWLREQALAVEE